MEPDNGQAIHIAPEAFAVASSTFPDQILDVWQNAFSGSLRGQVAGTNGVDIHAAHETIPDANTLRQQLPMSPTDARKYSINTILDSSPPSDLAFPGTLQPSLPALNGSGGMAQFYMLQDGKTGVFALGSFAVPSFKGLQSSILTGLQELKQKGTQKLIIDLTGIVGGECYPSDLREALL
jgi:hypothetical protein